MTVNDVYERVAEVVKPDRKLFFQCLNDCIGDLAASYGASALYYPDDNPAVREIKQGDSDLGINEIYHVALGDYIIYRMGGGDVYMEEYRRKADNAYHTLYHKRVKRVKRLVRRDIW